MWLSQAANSSSGPFGIRHSYYDLYTFFLILGFALPHHDESGEVLVEFFLDTLPDEPEKKRKFISALQGAHSLSRYQNASRFRVMRVADVDSKKHMLLQCSDVIIGALAFLMNDHDASRLQDGTLAPGTIERTKFARWVESRIARIHAEQCGSGYALTGQTWPGRDKDRNVLTVNNWRFRYRQWPFKIPRS